MTQTITLGFNEAGDPIEYRRLSARLPEFLAAYSPHEGYQIKMDYLDPIEAKPGLSELYKSAVAAGKKPEELGLPPVAGNTMIFRARLICPQGRELSSGSALVLIQAYKDWEKGETAARQRLLAAMGYGGDMLDVDEARDQLDQGFEPQTSNVAKDHPKAASKPKSESASAKALSETNKDKDSQESQKSSHSEAATATSIDAPTPDHVAAKPKASDVAPGHKTDGIPDSVIRQIEHQAKLKNVTPAEVTTKAEAKAELKRLISM